MTRVVNGVSMHLEAHAVADEGGVQRSGGQWSDFEALHAALELQEPQQTVTIRGHEYVLFAHAFCD